MVAANSNCTSLDTRPPIKSVASPAMEKRRSSTPMDNNNVMEGQDEMTRKKGAGTGKQGIPYSPRDPTSVDDIMETEELSVFYGPSPGSELAVAVSKTTLVDTSRATTPVSPKNSMETTPGIKRLSESKP